MPPHLNPTTTSKGEIPTMPNWTENHLRVTGDNLADFMTPIKNSLTDENKPNPNFIAKFIPMPDGLTNTVSPAPTTPDPDDRWSDWLVEGVWLQDEYDARVARRKDEYEAAQKAIAETGFADWHDWQIANWGVKWGASETVIVVDDKDCASIRFDTPWSPPLNAMHRISKMFPNLDFTLTYNEGGMCFMGVFRIKDGEVIYMKEVGDDDYPQPTPLDKYGNYDWSEHMDRVIDMMDSLTTEAEGA